MPLLGEGQVIRDTYRVERFLGEGAFAEVYRVRHPFLGRQAMKVFRRPGLSTNDIEKALGEAVLLSRLGHPNIVRVFDANTLETSSGVFGYFTMEYVPGGTLADHLAAHRGFLPVAEAVDIAVQVCRGLAVAHQKNPPIIHRDIKPQNLLMGHDGDATRVLVSDFGLARAVNPWTLMASTRGTMAFKAPETFLDPRGDSRAGDVWAIGSVLYLLLTAQMPHPELVAADPLAGAWYTGRLIPPRELRYVVDERLEKIVTRSLALDPSQRHVSAPELLTDLESWRTPAAPVPPPSVPPPSVPPPSVPSVPPAASERPSTRGPAPREEPAGAQNTGLAAGGPAQLTGGLQRRHDVGPALRQRPVGRIRRRGDRRPAGR
ncbi:serine/threonine-protein kinase [Pseudofrankia saprophytica]|uniref:serine/threonine-protein kinase n=1 Tax=Pseudofrankia saprophytica TaxID=298655 RepID=UPI000234CED4|nr:serine/threonine-protein kinase [Pseudofrankia saprophytica]